MAEKKLVIKLRYGAPAALNKTVSSVSKPSPYVWNIGRITLVLGIFLVLLLLVITLMNERSNQDDEEQLSEFSLLDLTNDSVSPEEKRQAPSSDPEFEEAEQSNAPDLTQFQASNEHAPTNSEQTTNTASHARPNHPGMAAAANVMRAQFTWGIRDMEPTSDIHSPAILQPGDTVPLHFYSEFQGMKGQTVFHEWHHDGRFDYSKDFKIKNDDWRVFSSRQLNSHALGEWEVLIRTTSGKTLGRYALLVRNPSK